MLALIDYKYVRFYLFRRAPKPWYDTAFGMRVLRFTALVSHRGRCGKSLRALYRTDADMVCFSDEFPVRKKFNMREPVFSIAYEYLLPEIIAQYGFEGKTAMLVAGADPRSVEMLKLLVIRYRYVLTFGIPRTALERLRRTYGASIISEPPDDRILQAQLAVFLRKPEKMKLASECVVLCADVTYLEHVHYTTYVSPPEFDAPGYAPDGFDRRVLLSEALRRGALPWSRVVMGNSQILTK